MEYQNESTNPILGDLDKICKNSTIYSFFIEEMTVNLKFVIAIVAIAVIAVSSLVLIYIKRRNTSSDYLIYPVGFSVFFIAFVFKILKSNYKSSALDLDQHLYNALKGLEENKSSIFTGIIMSVLGSVNKSGEVSNCEIKKIEDKNKVSNDVLDMQNYFTSFLNPKINDENQYQFKEKKNATILISSNKIKGFIPENPNNQSIEKDNANISRDKINLKPEREDDNSKNSKIKNAEILSDNIKSTNTKSTVHSSLGQDIPSVGNKVLASTIQNASESKNTDDDSNENVFSFSNIHKKLNKEFEINSKFSSNLRETNKTIDNIDKETQKLDANLKKLFLMSNKIEKELKSFNASSKAIEDLWMPIISNLRRIQPLKDVISNLDFKNNHKSNFVIRNDDDKEPVKEKYEYGGHELVFWLQISLLIQSILSIILLYKILTGGSVFMVKFSLAILFVLNCIFGVFLMIEAHFLDRDCIFGMVPNCNPVVSKDFVEFAQSVDQKIKPHEMLNTNNLKNSLDKIEKKTGNIVNILEPFIKDSPIKEFHTHRIIIKNFFDKITFVKDDFDDLTHSKVNRSEFFSLIDKIDINLAQIEQDLGFIDVGFLLEFYSKKFAFRDFLKNEKDKLILETEKEINSVTEKNAKSKKDACDKKRQEICRKRKEVNFAAMILIFGSLFVTVSFVFL